MLLASIHDVGPRSEGQVDRLADLIGGILGGPRFAMLVVPDHWGEAPLAQAPAFRARLRGWAEQGVEMFVHGWYHRDVAEHTGLAALKARHMTASEGEFLGLSQDVAAQRMADGRALIEDAIGGPVAGFIAPAWLYGPGARAALADSGFALAEDHMRVWEPGSGRVLARGPVVTWASRTRGRQLSSRAVAAVARQVPGLGRVARVAVHPGDTTVPALMASIAATFRAYARVRPAGRYAELLQP
ncbi:MAG: polysaccharide deacetylase family protein [Sphingomonadales bacterium]|nr:polysaccharide deacetylase family protein [Sphingomonadales bacterium]